MKYKSKLELQLMEIDKVISKEFINDPHIGVLAGISGLALFQFYYSKYLNREENAEVGINILTEAINKINNGYDSPSYCTGIAGVGWVIEHLVEIDFIELDCDDILENFDKFLIATMNKEMQAGNFDFLHSGIGYAFYFLKRFKNTNKLRLKERYCESLKNFIYMLKSTSLSDVNGIKWKSSLGTNGDLTGFNLGLSHGLSSIIIILAKLYEMKEFENLVSELLHGAISYLINSKNEGESLYSLYPSWIESGGQVKKRSRLAWCYGDLGIGLAFWHTSIALKDSYLRNEAINIFEHSSNRKSYDQTGIIDAGLCHGSFGIAQIFNYIHLQTNNLKYKEVASYWIENGLKSAVFEDGYAGYKHFGGMTNKWEAKTSLLEGVAGIGLAIIDHLGEQKNVWDECLMIS